jgi:hypothetical protein
MKKTRRKFARAIKAKVAIEALKELESLAEERFKKLTEWVKYEWENFEVSILIVL